MVIKAATFDRWGTIAMVPSREEVAAMRGFRIARLSRILEALR